MDAAYRGEVARFRPTGSMSAGSVLHGLLAPSKHIRGRQGVPTAPAPTALILRAELKGCPPQWPYAPLRPGLASAPQPREAHPRGLPGHVSGQALRSAPGHRVTHATSRPPGKGQAPGKKQHTAAPPGGSSTGQGCRALKKKKQKKEEEEEEEAGACAIEPIVCPSKLPNELKKKA